jgi:hypothetical protein
VLRIDRARLRISIVQSLTVARGSRLVRRVPTAEWVSAYPTAEWVSAYLFFRTGRIETSAPPELQNDFEYPILTRQAANLQRE